MAYSPNSGQASSPSQSTPATQGASYEWASKTLNLLSFCEARLSRDFHRTLAELRRTQELRRAEEAAAALGAEDLNKRTQTPAESSCFEPLTAPPLSNTSHPKSENPASLVGQPGPLGTEIQDANYFFAFPPSPSV
jgi:hypothetical protein